MHFVLRRWHPMKERGYAPRSCGAQRRWGNSLQHETTASAIVGIRTIPSECIEQSRRRERRSYRWLSSGCISSCGGGIPTLERGYAPRSCGAQRRWGNLLQHETTASAIVGIRTIPSECIEQSRRRERRSYRAIPTRVMVTVKGLSGTRRLFQYMPGQSLAKKYSWRSDEPLTDGGAIQSRCWPMGNAWSRTGRRYRTAERKVSTAGGSWLATGTHAILPVRV